MPVTLKTKTVLLLTIVALALQTTGAVPVFEGEVVNYRNGTVEFRDLRINHVDEVRNISSSGNEFRLVARHSGEEYWSLSKNLSFVKWYSPYGEYREIEKVIDMVRIPARNDSIELAFYRNGERKLEINTSNLTSSLCVRDGVCKSFCRGKEADVDCTCGDDICQESLNEEEFCPEDCRAPSNEDENPQQTPPESGDAERQEVIDRDITTYILLGILIVAIGIGILLFSGKIEIEA